MDVPYHPLFERWLMELAGVDEEIFGEVMALLNALRPTAATSTMSAAKNPIRS